MAGQQSEIAAIYFFGMVLIIQQIQATRLTLMASYQ